MWFVALTVYLVTGLFIILFSPARRVITASLNETDFDSVPTWKAYTFRIILGIAALFLWPVFLPSWLHKKRSAWDELQANPTFQEQKALFDAMSMLSEDGCETDEMPGGYGEFGHSVTNPIPTKTVFGSTSYLESLRTPDGEKVVCEREGSLSSPVSTHPVDAYAITHLDGRRLATLYLSPYHKRNSEKAPNGFLLFGTIMC